jgi:hypothetical protein
MQLSVTPTFDSDNTHYEERERCHFCKSKINIQPTFYNNKTISCCFLCHITINFQKEYTYHVVLCETKMSQLDIIKKTWESYNKKGYVPLPTKIDTEAKIIKIPVYLFAQFDNKQIENYGIFFTNKVQNMMINDTDDVFGTFENIEKYKVGNYFNIEEYEISDEEKNKINEEKNKLRKNNFAVMIEIENKLKNRYTNFN